MTEPENYMIELGDEKALELGFTADRYGMGSYLWRDGDRVLVLFIETIHRGQGDLSRLFSNIEAKGLRVAVPTPLGRMQAILERKGFRPHREDFEGADGVEVWERG